MTDSLYFWYAFFFLLGAIAMRLAEYASSVYDMENPK
jgi:hypothetical protein